MQVVWHTFPMAKRGSYAKGVVRREEILSGALEVIASAGIRGASVKEIADAVGLSQPGLLHYFGSKDELFTAIIRKRDELDGLDLAQALKVPAGLERLTAVFLALIRHNAAVPGLVELFSRLAVDAADPEHPAHGYFLERSATFRTIFVAELRNAQDEGVLTDAIPAESMARILQATVDGLQLQWLTDPGIDMAALTEDLLTVFRAPSAHS